MRPDGSSSAFDLERLLERARSLRPVSQGARARVLARVHASVFAGSASTGSNAPPSLPAASRAAWLGGTVAAIGLVGAAIAVQLHGRQTSTAESGASVVASRVAISRRLDADPAPTAPVVAPDFSTDSAAPAQTARVARIVPLEDSYVAELDLLRRAHTACEARDFATALRFLAEHGRRFPNGRLSEEREALRVRALTSSGNGEAARLAAKAFALRFPHSVLLSRTMSAADAGDLAKDER
jgi:hypothetical protein